MAIFAYALFTVAFGCGIIYLVQTQTNRFSWLPSAEAADELGYKAVIIGFPLLALNLILGAYWANYAWGHYWSWDPKETSALVTWLVYAIYLHVRGVRGLRVGVPREYFFEGVDPEVEKGFEQALATLRQLGASVEDVQIPSIQSAGAFMAIMLTEAFAYHENDLREHPELFGEMLRERLLAGALITGSEYVQAQRIRTRLSAEMNALLRRVDVLATPTSPKPAPTFTQVYDPEYGFPRGNTGPFNMTGLPSLAVPCGFTAAGLPISLQITGRAFDETTVLRVGHTYEQATDWHKRHPAL
jgi:aspartyl-tRNA(Asn)/glutamyl-tRNA(Gln) amidotransferase subunit A